MWKAQIGGKWYYFDENGVRQTGWIETEDGKSYGMQMEVYEKVGYPLGIPIIIVTILE